MDCFHQQLCQTKANAKTTEMLMGVKHCHVALGVPMPEMIIMDNCCQVCRVVESALPEMDCILDVRHFIARYGVCDLPFCYCAHTSNCLNILQSFSTQQETCTVWLSPLT